MVVTFLEGEIMAIEKKLTVKGLMKLLKENLGRARVSAKQYPGLILNISPQRSIKFLYRYQVEDARKEMTFGVWRPFNEKDNALEGQTKPPTLKELLAEHARLVSLKGNEDDAKAQADPLRERQEIKKRERASKDKRSFKALTVRYLTRYAKAQLKPRTVAEYVRLIDNHILPVWSGTPIDKIDKTAVIDLVEEISLKTPIQANRVLATVKGVFTYAVDVNLLKASPAANVKPPGKEVVKERVLSETELKELFVVLDDVEKCPRNFADALRLILLTGQRPGEIVAMRLSQIKDGWFEMDGREIKPGVAHRVYLSAPARQIIKDRIKDFFLEKYVFPVEGKTPFMRRDTLTSRVRKLQQHLPDLETFTPHDLRRTAATHIAKLGHGSVVPDILAHSIPGITRKFYDKYNRAPEIEAALIAWANKLQQIESGATQTNVIQANFT